MKKKIKKGLTLIEIVIFVFILSVLGLLVFNLFSTFFSGLKKSQTVKDFSESYNKVLNYIYSNGYEGWFYTGTSNKNIVLYNSGDILGYSGYMGYNCMPNGIGITYVATGRNQIIWDNYQKTFTGFDCRYLTGWESNGGYWLELGLRVLSRDFTLKYYIYNKQN